MFRRSGVQRAKVYNIPWEAGTERQRNMQAWNDVANKRRLGMIQVGRHNTDERTLRQSCNQYLKDLDSTKGRKFTGLAGVEYQSDLPADPITRLFFQAKGDQALYEGNLENPAVKDLDRLEIANRHTGDYHNPWTRYFTIPSPVMDFCRRVSEGSEKRKRFVVVPASPDTKGIAQVMHDHGLLAGFRDFHNDRAFAVELKYFQNEPVFEDCEPVSRDVKVEYDWSPNYLDKRCGKGIEVYILKTHTGEVISGQEAKRRQIGGKGLCMIR